ncbi:MAG TPA: PilC/PilY family type IV pilus protein, partial [Thermoanaerobaculia bacterium]
GAGFKDMGESWSKPAMGRVKLCTANCGNTSAPFPVTEDRYVAIFGGGFDRERLNRRGNWLYVIDIETGRVLYRANSSCGVNSGAGGCTPVYFASIPSEPAAIDGNGDGYIDLVYVGDLKGRLWRIDLTDLRLLSSPPSGRWSNQLDVSDGSGKPFLLFEAPQPVSPATEPFYPIYYRPTAVSLGFSVSGKPALGIAFGTGDRDDILAKVDPASLDSRQRFYYVVDKANTATRTETDLYHIASATAPANGTCSIGGASCTESNPCPSGAGECNIEVPSNGWYIELAKGERIITDSISVNGVIFFSTFNPSVGPTGSSPCLNSGHCNFAGGTARLFRVSYATGNPYLGSLDRGENQQYGGFLSEPVYFQSTDQSGNIMYTTENTVKTEKGPGGKKTSVKSWKERSRRP